MVKVTQSSPPVPSSSRGKPAPNQSQSGSKNQQSILGFFKKKDMNDSSPSHKPAKQSPVPVVIRNQTRIPASSQPLTPVPSSDAVNASSSQEGSISDNGFGLQRNGLPSPVTPAATVSSSPPGRRVSYALIFHHHIVDS